MRTNLLLILIALSSILSFGQSSTTVGSPEYYDNLILQYQIKIDWVNERPDEIEIANQSNWFQMAEDNIAKLQEYKNIALHAGTYMPEGSNSNNRDMNEEVMPGGPLCDQAAPFCTEETYTFPLSVDAPSAETGPDYDCLGSQPNPVWYFLRINCDGTLDFHLFAGSDLDFIIWGPFTEVVCDYAQLQSGNVVDCSFSATNDEWPTIPNATVGEYYMFLITNYANTTQDFTLEQTGGVGCTDCSILFPGADNNGPLCTGQTLELYNTNDDLANDPDITIYWTGPNGFTSSDLNPVIPNIDLSYAGVYTLTAYNNQGDTTTTTTTVVVEDLTADLVKTDVLCNGATDGSASVSITNTSNYADYSFDWHNITDNTYTTTPPQASGTDNYTNLGAANYDLTITDSRSCTWVGSFEIIEPEAIEINLSSEPSYCGIPVGKIDVNITNGQANYQIDYSGTATGTANTNLLDHQFTDLNFGNYSILVTDANGCTTTEDISINDIGSVEANFTWNGNQCFDNQAYDFTNLGSSGLIYNTQPTYNWSFNQGTPASSNLESPIGINFNTSGVHAVSFTVSLGTSCSDQVSQNIEVYPSPIIDNITSTPTDCFDTENGELNASVSGTGAPYQYTWEGPNSSQYLSNPIVTIPRGNYFLTVTDANGCIATSNAIVDSPTEIILDLESTPTSCYGYSDGFAEVTATGGVTPYTYYWDNGNISNSTANIPADLYHVTVTDFKGCKKIASIEVDQPNAVILDLPINPTICIGESMDIIMSVTSSPFSPYQFYWEGVESTNGEITVSPIVTTTYTAQAIDAHGCESMLTPITINVNDSLNLIVSPKESEICEGEGVNIQCIASGGNGNYIFKLQDGSTINSTSQLFPEATQDYTITVYDDCASPIDSYTINVKVNNNPIPSFHASEYSGCQPYSIDFIQDVSTHEDGTRYFWDFGDETTSNISLSEQPTHNYKVSGQFDVQLKIIDQNGCMGEITKHNYINIFPKPKASFKAQPPVVSQIKPIIYFENTSEGSVSSIWNFGDGLPSTEAVNIEYRYKDISAEYLVELIAVSNMGCMDSTSSKVLVQDAVTFYAPTAFTPDGDGKNDSFKIYGHGIEKEGFLLQVYDRWGEVVYKTTDISEAWNGKSKNGYYAKPGYYTWNVEYLDVYKIPHKESGYVNLIQ